MAITGAEWSAAAAVKLWQYRRNGQNPGIEIYKCQMLVAARNEIFRREMPDFVAIRHDLVAPIRPAPVAHQPNRGNFPQSPLDFTAGPSAVKQKPIHALVENPTGNLFRIGHEMECDIDAVVCPTE